jgi:hypothetical protein
MARYLQCTVRPPWAQSTYKAVSDVFQNIDPHPPLQPASVSFPRNKGRGYTLAGRWGVNILEDASHRIDLLQKSLYDLETLDEVLFHVLVRHPGGLLSQLQAGRLGQEHVCKKD